jgi:cytochrome c oxidase assembly protein subunit 11
MAGRAPVTPDPAKNRRVALGVLAVFVGMIGLTYASVPLYRLFCQATGFGGTTQRADAAPGARGTKTIIVRFDTNTSSALGWNFHAAQAPMMVKLGEQNMAHFTATNATDHLTVGSATYNVSPESAGAFFNKIQCFCFTRQELRAGETVDLPVVFFVDPAIMDDPDAKAISEITLSYTFYPADKPATVSAAQVPQPPVAN